MWQMKAVNGFSGFCLGICLIPQPAVAESGQRIATQGGANAGAVACISCHGVDGEGNAAAGFPRLAGLDAGYLERQLHLFRDGGRKNPVMAGVAKALSNAEIEVVADYYAGLPAVSVAVPPTDAALPQGEALARVGDWRQRGLPACDQCHGPKGQGVGAEFPPLVGQPPAYLAGQIGAWKSGLRTSDPLGLMKHVADRLTEAETQSVAAYYASLAVTGSVNDASTGSAATSAAADGEEAGVHKQPVPDLGKPDVGREPVAGKYFQPPARNSYPEGPFGESVRVGEAIFTGTDKHPVSGQYVGNRQSCENCHLDAGRLANSAPMWASWVAYPAYRKKNKKVNTQIERIQGCFTYSMNAHDSVAGHPPSDDSETMVSLMSYFYWLATGAPTGDRHMAGRGYARLEETAKGFDPDRGREVYTRACAICHGEDGKGRTLGPDGDVVFPPLWGMTAYNWGAGMHKIDTAAAYIKWNMPLGLASPMQKEGFLSDQDAWDVAAFVDSHPRPQDPRYSGSLEETTERFHGSKFDYYGKRKGPDGRLLGLPAPKK